MRALTLRQKLMLPLIIAIAAVLLFSALSMHNSNTLQKQANIMATEFVPAISEVLNADRDLYQAHLALLEFIATGNKEHLTALDENTQQAKDRLEKFNQLMAKHPLAQTPTAAFNQKFEDWKKANQKVINKNSITVFNASKDSFESLREIYDTAGEKAIEQAQALREKNDRQQQTLSTIVSITAVLILLYLIIISYLSPKIVSARIQKVSQRLKEINNGGGDLRQRINFHTHDEIGELCNEFNGTLETLATMMKNIRDETCNLRKNSQQLNDVIIGVQNSTEQQNTALSSLATSFHESATATEEVASIAVKTADQTQSSTHAVKGSMDNVQTTANNIVRLSSDFGNTYSTADSLMQNSTEIASVVETIRSIAEQTNLLALNAAIEAARAGEQGRGFAVVADEVRTLASRTQTSTNDIQEIVSRLHNQIEEVFSAISAGKSQLENTNNLTQTTSAQLSEVSAVMDEIGNMTLQTATATEEQSQVSAEINRNIAVIDEVAQHNASAIEDIQIISQQLNTLAQGLEKGINQFQV